MKEVMRISKGSPISLVTIREGAIENTFEARGLVMKPR